MQQVYQNTSRVVSSKTTRFLKRSFFFALLYSTLLFILIRVFFYEFPFTIGEGFELHSKVLLVVWMFIIICKLVITGVNLVEKKINKIEYERIMYMPVLKKTIFIMLTAVMAYAGKAQANDNKIADRINNPKDEAAIDQDIHF